MHSDSRDGSTHQAGASALFLFAHQDDEFGVFHQIERCVRRGLRVHCAYLTDGAYRQVAPERRNRESLAVLARLGVRPECVAFGGGQAGIADGSLPERLAAADAWLRHWLAQLHPIDSIYVPAWEGGHHDHDALHALAVSLAHELGIIGRVKQFPLYHGSGCVHPMFRVLSPLPANGAVTRERFERGARARYLRLCLSYPSQANAWLLLFAPVAWRYLWRGAQELQPVALQRIAGRPHPGRLYYERRGFYDWDRMRARLLEAGLGPCENFLRPSG